jgi:spore germination protein GerM
VSIGRLHLLVAVLAVLLGILGYVGIRHMGFGVEKSITGEFQPSKVLSVKRYPYQLFFADKQKNYLTAETRLLNASGPPEVLGRTILEALIKGPESNLLPTVPKKTSIRALYVDKNHTAVIDFHSNIQENHLGGAYTELLTIYSIVNSLTLNVAEIDSVKFLINGKEVDTLAGHVDIKSPFNANLVIIR